MTHASAPAGCPRVETMRHSLSLVESRENSQHSKCSYFIFMYNTRMVVSISKLVTGIVLTIAIAIGSIATYKQELFFKIPKYGFILWAITGGAMPPYIVPGPFEEGNTDWLKDGDVVVTVAPKSGTTWMLYCSHQIRVKGNDEKFPYKDVSLSTPWPELIQVTNIFFFFFLHSNFTFANKILLL